MTNEQLQKDFEEEFPAGTIGHKHTGKCEFHCCLKDEILGFIRRKLKQQERETREGMLGSMFSVAIKYEDDQATKPADLMIYFKEGLCALLRIENEELGYTAMDKLGKTRVIRLKSCNCFPLDKTSCFFTDIHGAKCKCPCHYRTKEKVR